MRIPIHILYCTDRNNSISGERARARNRNVRDVGSVSAVGSAKRLRGSQPGVTLPAGAGSPHWAAHWLQFATADNNNNNKKTARPAKPIMSLSVVAVVAVLTDGRNALAVKFNYRMCSQARVFCVRVCVEA